MTNFDARLLGASEEAQPDHATVFFFGAGASVPAGVPDTKGFVEAFRKSLEGEPDALAETDELLKLLAQAGQQADIEALLEAFDYLDPGARERIPALAVTEPKYQFSKTDAASLRKKLHELIVKRAVVQAADVGYLDPLADFFQSKGPLDVFSVNYDTCVELFCHTRRIKFTDGFGVEWRPSEFDRADIQLRLIKLHGSVLWYETSTGTCVRIPVVPKSGEHTLFTHESAQPLMLYPARKWAYAEPLLHNLELFRTRLSEPATRNIIVVGYSFRDEHLRRIFFDVLRSNLESRIILIAPNAWEIYQSQLEFLDVARTIPSPARNRVVCLPYGFQDVFPLLRDKLAVLPKLGAVHGRVAYDWAGTLDNAFKSEDIATAIAIAPRVSFDYFYSEGTKRAIRAYFTIRLLEAAQGRDLLSSFPQIAARFREIIGSIRLELGNPRSANYHFKLDARMVKKEDGTHERTQTLDLHELKDTLEWTLRDYAPILKAGEASDAPIVKKFRTLRDRIALLSNSAFTQYELMTLPYFEKEADRARYKDPLNDAVTQVRASTADDTLAKGCELVCEIERALLAELTCLPGASSQADIGTVKVA